MCRKRFTPTDLLFEQPLSFCPALRANGSRECAPDCVKQSIACTATVFSPRPACGERSRASCERVRGILGRLALADTPPHPETLLRAVSDLSPQAGRGCLSQCHCERKRSNPWLGIAGSRWIASSLHSSQRRR